MISPRYSMQRRLENLPVINSSGPWYRAHIINRDPQIIGEQGLFRFDPPLGEDYSTGPKGKFETYYAGCTREAAFLDALGGIQPLPEHLVTERRITDLTAGTTIPIADLTGLRIMDVLGYDRDLFIDAYSRSDWDRPNLNYRLTRILAAALWDVGFEGVQYYADHQPYPEERSVALFFEADSRYAPLKAGQPEPIDSGLLSELRHRFGIEVLPSDPLPW
jgi:hypothetical protein